MLGNLATVMGVISGFAFFWAKWRKWRDSKL
jgi:hypothetical protein